MPDTTQAPTETLARDDGATIAYRRVADRSGGKLPGLVFLGGFASDMSGTKAGALESFARLRGQGYLRFDYFGHGKSSGAFADGTIGRWRDDALVALDRLTTGPQILIGSSMGGWIMLLVALARAERIAGLVGIAAAPDFTEELIWKKLPPPALAELTRTGRWHEPSRYGADLPITLALIEEGRRHLLLDRPIGIRRPVRLLHGMRDPDVPWRWALRIAERIEGPDVVTTLIKDGEHRLSRDEDLRRIEAAIAELSDRARPQAPAARSAASPSR
jgi:pimeloyl-ACP methyl ester carboxylesterase